MVRGAFIDRAGGDGSSVEGIHGSLIGGEEAHMGAVADGGGAAVEGALDPELGIFAAPGDRTRCSRMRLQPRVARTVIEGNRLVEAIAAQEMWERMLGFCSAMVRSP